MKANWDAPLPSHTRFGSQHVSYASNCVALAVASMYDEEEPVWHKIQKNGWLLCVLKMMLL